VVGTYGNIQITTSGDCGGFTPADSSRTFEVTIADPQKGVVTIEGNGTFTGTLAPDYSFRFDDASSSGAVLDGRFQRKGGTIVMSGSTSLGGCSISFTATRVGG
jgi:hypothetical protein